MRADEFIKEDEKLDEIIPLVVGAARGIGAAAKVGSLAAKGVAGAAKLGAKAVGAAARGVNRAVGNTIGTAAKSAYNAATNDKEDSPEIDQAKDQMLKPGNKIKLPTSSTGPESEFKVTRRQGDDVEIENPNAGTNAQEPSKFVYKAQDLKKTMATQ